MPTGTHAGYAVAGRNDKGHVASKVCNCTRWHATAAKVTTQSVCAPPPDDAASHPADGLQLAADLRGCLRRSLLLGQLNFRDREGNDGSRRPGTLEQ